MSDQIEFELHVRTITTRALHSAGRNSKSPEVRSAGASLQYLRHGQASLA